MLNRAVSEVVMGAVLMALPALGAVYDYTNSMSSTEFTVQKYLDPACPYTWDAFYTVSLTDTRDEFDHIWSMNNYYHTRGALVWTAPAGEVITHVSYVSLSPIPALFTPCAFSLNGNPLGPGSTVEWSGAEGPGWTWLNMDKSYTVQDHLTQVGFGFDSTQTYNTWPLAMKQIVITTLGPATVTGTVALQGYLGDNTTVGVRFEFQSLGGGDNFTRTVLLDRDGAFQLDNITLGQYRLAVRNNASLSTVLDNVTVAANPTALADPIVLRSADINGDNQVSFEDFSVLQNNYGQSGGSAANPLAAAATGGCGAMGLLLLSILGLALGWKH